MSIGEFVDFMYSLFKGKICGPVNNVLSAFNMARTVKAPILKLPERVNIASGMGSPQKQPAAPAVDDPSVNKHGVEYVLVEPHAYGRKFSLTGQRFERHITPPVDLTKGGRFGG